MITTSNIDSLFLEMGKAVYLFQLIEARIKLMLPHISKPGSSELPNDEGFAVWRKYIDSKETLGNLVKLLQERMSVDEPEKLEQEWRLVVQYRNDVVHHFALQPFAGCKTPEEFRVSIEYIRMRRLRAIPFFQMLGILIQGFVAALDLLDGFEGEIPIDPSCTTENTGNSSSTLALYAAKSNPQLS